MCFDCRMMCTFAVPLLHLIRNDNANVPENSSADWAKSFATNITIDKSEYANPM